MCWKPCFLSASVGLDCLISRALPIQHDIFSVKLAALLASGTFEPDFGLLLNPLPRATERSRPCRLRSVPARP